MFIKQGLVSAISSLAVIGDARMKTFLKMGLAVERVPVGAATCLTLLV